MQLSHAPRSLAIPDSPSNSVTALMERAQAGDAGAREELWSRVYQPIRRIAAKILKKQGPGVSLQATALANEAVVRMLPRDLLDRFETRGHLLGFSAVVMRRLLIDRRRGANRRPMVAQEDVPEFEQIAQLFETARVDLIELDGALERLATLDPAKARLVELRFFTGMSIKDAADELGYSESTAIREWRFVKSWLRKELG